MQPALLFVAALLICCNSIYAQETPKHADAILREAEVLAARENKQVFIIFHASWCGWCRKMDSAMNDVSCKALFNDNYIIRHLVVHESPNKKNLENPGALELLKKYYSEDKGIPYWLIFDKQGKFLADARRKPEGAAPDVPGNNVGCPSTKEEVAYFLQVLKQTSSLTPAQLQVIGERFSR